MNESSRLRCSLAAGLLSCLFLPLRTGAQPTPTPGRAFRTRIDHRIRVDAQATPTATPGRTIRTRIDHLIHTEATTVTAGTIEGRVTDSSGTALPGVTCRASSAELGVTRETVTDNTGLCRLPLLPAGTYQLTVYRPGFNRVERPISVSLGKTSTANITLSGMIYTVPGPPPQPTPVVVAPPPPPPPPSPGVPRNGGPRPTPSAAQPIREAYWNSWIQNRPPGPAAATKVEIGKKYDINFDLAAFNYSTFRESAATTSTVIDEALIEELNQFTGDKMKIYVKPILAGRGLEFLPEQSATRSVEVVMKQLREPPGNWSKDDPLPEIADKVKAARVGIGVRAVGPGGCASLGLSIWNDALDRPIDYVVRNLRVGGDVNDPACVGGGSATKPLQRNFASLLAGRPDLPADAALHVFEMAPGSDEPKSYAVFVARQGPMLTWVLGRHLSRYVTEPSGLLNRLGAARATRRYEVVAEDLKEVLFHGDSGQDQADAALEALTDLARRPKKATVFVRLANLQGESVFFPVGLTELGNGLLLGDAATVVQPLPRETYTSADQRCIQSWKMVLPEDLGSAVGGAFLTPVASPMSNRTTSWPDFKTYAGSPPADPTRAEGLLLLAHQDGGRIWFVPNSADSLKSENISHKFPSGSVAVLAACSVGDLNAESSGVGLLRTLNRLGIDAVVVSPFAVRGPVGARFAFHFADEILKAQQRRETAQLADLFQRAVEETRKDTSIASEKNGVYEFLLAGNGGLRLCP